MEKKRLVVTGMSVISCLGNDPVSMYDNLLAGKSGIRTITDFDVSEFSTKFAGCCDFDPGDLIDKKQARRIDRCIAFALWAGKKAIVSAGFQLDDMRQEARRVGVLLGSGIGGLSTLFENTKNFCEKGPRRVSPFFIPYILSNMGGALLAAELGMMGPNYSISTACATANYAILAAAEHIRRGDADVMICGGIEAPLAPIGLAGFCSIGALSQRNDAPEKASRPWDKGRDGFVMAEGAGVIVLESLEHASRRDAPILAEFLGGATNCDGYHMTDPRPDGIGVAACIEAALRDAAIGENKIEYINAHATSTPVGDMAEVRALEKIFSRPEHICMNATKSMTGHALGAAGGIEAVATIEALRRGIVHPTINMEDPESLPFIVSGTSIDRPLMYALSNSFGFGGHNGSIVLARYV